MTLPASCEQFWAGPFGDDYILRNSDSHLPQLLKVWADILSHIDPSSLNSVFEIGTNIGLNLDAIRLLIPHCTTSGVEINLKASEVASKKGHSVRNCSVHAFEPGCSYDLAFTYTVLIHMPPETLDSVLHKLYSCSTRYIMLAEYFSRDDQEVIYRGNSSRLFKSDFASRLLDLYPNLRLIDYRFIWRRDSAFSEDDITWFLFEKNS